jgi:hypothetical protein
MSSCTGDTAYQNKILQIYEFIKFSQIINFAVSDLMIQKKDQIAGDCQQVALTSLDNCGVTFTKSIIHQL